MPVDALWRHEGESRTVSKELIRGSRLVLGLWGVRLHLCVRLLASLLHIAFLSNLNTTHSEPAFCAVRRTLHLTSFTVHPSQRLLTTAKAPRPHHLPSSPLNRYNREPHR